MSRLAKIPTLSTASVPDELNGPLIPQIHECNPEAVRFEYIAPPYRALTERYDKAQDLQKVRHETKLERLEAARRPEGAPAPA